MVKHVIKDKDNESTIEWELKIIGNDVNLYANSELILWISSLGRLVRMSGLKKDKLIGLNFSSNGKIEEI